MKAHQHRLTRSWLLHRQCPQPWWSHLHSSPPRPGSVCWQIYLLPFSQQLHDGPFLGMIQASLSWLQQRTGASGCKQLCRIHYHIFIWVKISLSTSRMSPRIFPSLCFQGRLLPPSSSWLSPSLSPWSRCWWPFCHCHPLRVPWQTFSPVSLTFSQYCLRLIKDNKQVRLLSSSLV